MHHIMLAQHFYLNPFGNASESSDNIIIFCRILLFKFILLSIPINAFKIYIYNSSYESKIIFATTATDHYMHCKVNKDIMFNRNLTARQFLLQTFGSSHLLIRPAIKKWQEENNLYLWIYFSSICVLSKKILGGVLLCSNGVLYMQMSRCLYVCMSVWNFSLYIPLTI